MTIYDEIQPFIDGNKWVDGQANTSNTIEKETFVLYCSPAGQKHILSRHADKYAPGSLLVSGFNLMREVEAIVETAPNVFGKDDTTGEPGSPVDERGMVKWLERDTGSTVGYMGVAKADPAEVASMTDYSMDGYHGIEKVKIAPGEREETSLLSVVTAKIGELSDGRMALSLVTIYPGSNTIDGTEIPHSRPAFAAAGLYFVLPEDHASFQR